MIINQRIFLSNVVLKITSILNGRVLQAGKTRCKNITSKGSMLTFSFYLPTPINRDVVYIVLMET